MIFLSFSTSIRRKVAISRKTFFTIFNNYFSGENIPDFITKILHHLELYGTMKEGIYRVPGAKLEVDRLKSKLDSDPHCINIDFDAFNVNAVAAAFKDFLRKLPVPLLPYDVSTCL